jgi:hypothetical protein
MLRVVVVMDTGSYYHREQLLLWCWRVTIVVLESNVDDVGE